MSDEMGLAPVAWRVKWSGAVEGECRRTFDSKAIAEGFHAKLPAPKSIDPLYDAAAIERLVAERDEARALSDRLKLEAQVHAMEARGANATIHEIYQVVSGAKGEPGNWHGATPVRERFVALTEALKPFASEKLPSSRATEIAYNEFGLRCLMSPLAIARQRARQAIGDT